MALTLASWDANLPRDRAGLGVRPGQVVRPKVVGHAVDGDALTQPTDPAELLQHGHVVKAPLAQEPGGREASRAGPDDRDPRELVDPAIGHDQLLDS